MPAVCETTAALRDRTIGRQIEALLERELGDEGEGNRPRIDVVHWERSGARDRGRPGAANRPRYTEGHGQILLGARTLQGIPNVTITDAGWEERARVRELQRERQRFLDWQQDIAQMRADMERFQREMTRMMEQFRIKMDELVSKHELVKEKWVQVDCILNREMEQARERERLRIREHQMANADGPPPREHDDHQRYRHRPRDLAEDNRQHRGENSDGGQSDGASQSPTPPRVPGEVTGLVSRYMTRPPAERS